MSMIAYLSLLGASTSILDCILFLILSAWLPAPNLCELLDCDKQVRRGWSASTETKNYTTILEVPYVNHID